MQHPKFTINDVVYAVYIDKKFFEVVEIKIAGIKYTFDEYYYATDNNMIYRESILRESQEEALAECMEKFAILNKNS